MAIAITLAVSIVLNIISWSLVVILWNIRCKSCEKDKEFKRVFYRLCNKCKKNDSNGEKDTKKTKAYDIKF